MTTNKEEREELLVGAGELDEETTALVQKTPARDALQRLESAGTGESKLMASASPVAGLKNEDLEGQVAPTTPVKAEESKSLRKAESTAKEPLKSLSLEKSSRKQGSQSCRAFLDLYVETFDPIVLLIPYVFQQIGILYATHVLLVSTFLLGLSAKLMLESTRLQPNNLQFQRNEDYESLINGNRMTQSWIISLTGKLYPVQLIISTSIATMVLSGVANEAINYQQGDASGDQFLFGILPALDRNRTPIEGTDLINFSRGFFAVMALALAYLTARNLWMARSPNRSPATSVSLTVSLLAIAALLISLCVQAPTSFRNASLSGRFEEIEFPKGEDVSVGSVFVYSAILLYCGSNMPFSVPDMASQHKKSNLPLLWGLSMSFLTKWLIGFLGSMVLLNAQTTEDDEAVGGLWASASLVGITIYAVLQILPQIVAGQSFVQQVLYYRGSLDAPVSAIAAVVLPWLCAGLINSYASIMVLIVLITPFLILPVTYMSPIFFYSTCIFEGAYFETNFRLSLKQMYDGDRLSKKETSILPKTYYSSNATTRKQSKDGEGRTTLGGTAAGNASTVVTGYTDLFNNFKGSIKCTEYPTTMLLRQSKLKESASFILSTDNEGESSGNERCLSLDLDVHGRDQDGANSDISELRGVSEQASCPINSDKLTKCYNEQGHYATLQSLRKIFTQTLATRWSQTSLMRVLYILACLIMCLSGACFYFWVQRESPASVLKGVMVLSDQTAFSDEATVNLAQTAAQSQAVVTSGARATTVLAQFVANRL